MYSAFTNGRAAPPSGERQEPNAGEEIAQEGVLLHAHETGRRRRTQPTPAAAERPAVRCIHADDTPGTEHRVHSQWAPSLGLCDILLTIALA